MSIHPDWLLCVTSITNNKRLSAFHFSEPEDVLSAFFDFPDAARHAELCSARLAERPKDQWRTPKAYVSVASSSDNPEMVDFDGTRASHDLLVSATFGYHPFYGLGHILRTSGVIALFWNSEEVAIVEHKNVKLLRPVVSGTPVQSRRKRILAAAMSKD